jgi:pyridoxine/pyridoxamine 5'-phosphate oxidase
MGIQQTETRMTKEKLIWKQNEYGNYRVFLDGIEFRGLRQARLHLKKKEARAKRRNKNK